MDQRNIDAFRQQVLEEFDRLKPESKFKFRCFKGAECFTRCCGDVNIVLTPYDIIRMKNRLGISSDELLNKYTVQPFNKASKLPIVLLKMEDDEKKKCLLVSEDGCTVYEDRPWPCRMYPVGLASPKEIGEGGDEDFYFLVREDHCLGFEEGNEWTVQDWMDDQGVEEYDGLGRLFKEISLHDFFIKGGDLDPYRMEMFFMVAYNIDKFRRFVFESSFLKRFNVDADRLEKVKTDDVELLRFGFEWLKFALFGEETIDIKEEVRKWYEDKKDGKADIFEKRTIWH